MIRRALLGALVGFVAFTSIAFVAEKAFYRYAPSEYFLKYYYAKADNSLVGQPVQLTLCREKYSDYIRATATRLFIVTQSGREVGNYDFALTIDGDENCTVVQVPVARQPQAPGTYIMRTSGEFYVHGNRKTFSYETKPYVISTLPGSVEQSIQDLQMQIDQLRTAQ